MLVGSPLWSGGGSPLELAFHKERKNQAASVPREPSLCIIHQAGYFQAHLKKNQCPCLKKENSLGK